MRKNEHPRCSCRSCVLGGNSKAGQCVHKQVNRKIRRTTKEMLKKQGDDFDQVIVSTPYTD